MLKKICFLCKINLTLVERPNKKNIELLNLTQKVNLFLRLWRGKYLPVSYSFLMLSDGVQGLHAGQFMEDLFTGRWVAERMVRIAEQYSFIQPHTGQISGFWSVWPVTLGRRQVALLEWRTVLKQVHYSNTGRWLFYTNIINNYHYHFDFDFISYYQFSPLSSITNSLSLTPLSLSLHFILITLVWVKS